MLTDCSNLTLKKIIRQYNLHVSIKGYSKMTKEELIKAIHDHLIYENGKLTFKNVNAVIDEPVKAVRKPRTKEDVNNEINEAYDAYLNDLKVVITEEPGKETIKKNTKKTKVEKSIPEGLEPFDYWEQYMDPNSTGDQMKKADFDKLIAYYNNGFDKLSKIVPWLSNPERQLFKESSNNKRLNNVIQKAWEKEDDRQANESDSDMD